MRRVIKSIGAPATLSVSNTLTSDDCEPMTAADWEHIQTSITFNQQQHNKMSTHTKTQKTVALVNPWSGAEAPDQVLTWPQITGWAAINIHADSRKEWLGQAREAFRDNDGETLGSMIIGS